MKIEFILKPSRHGCCNRIDFKQVLFFLNEEGSETTYSEWTNPPNYMYSFGVVYGDPPNNYYIAESHAEARRTQSGLCIRGLYVESFYSFMLDEPSRAFLENGTMDMSQYYVYVKGKYGRPEKRRISAHFATTAICIDGIEEGVSYGSVKWSLDYPDLKEGTKPILKIDRFDELGG